MSSNLGVAIGLGVSAGSGALAAIYLGSSMGAAGGAIFGVCNSLTSGSVAWLSHTVFGLNKNSSSTANTISLIVSQILSHLAIAAACPYLGIGLSFKAALILSLTTTGIGIAASAILGLLFVTGYCAIATYRPKDA